MSLLHHAPKIAAAVMAALSVVVAPASAEWIRARGVGVELVLFCQPTDQYPCLFLSAGDDAQGNAGAGWLFLDPNDGTILGDRHVVLEEGDLVVNQTATEATLNFPGTSLRWTTTNIWTLKQDLDEVSILYGVSRRSSWKILTNDASVKGVLDDRIIDTLAAPPVPYRPGATHIDRSVQRRN
jgi:hypothetical protein